jgi:hypothetical protein
MSRSPAITESMLRLRRQRPIKVIVPKIPLLADTNQPTATTTRDRAALHLRSPTLPQPLMPRAITTLRSRQMLRANLRPARTHQT